MGLQKVYRKIRRAILRDEPGYYDMYENPGEQYFARLYLAAIQKILSQKPKPLSILDAGCQTGRLSIPLAQAGHQVVGVDTSDLALRRAQRHAKEIDVPLKLIRADLGKWLPQQPPEGFDVVVCTEVLYLRKNHQQLLQGLLRLIKPGGVCFISHRPTGYYLAEAFQHRDWESVQRLLTAKEGTILGSYYNWQNPNDLEILYQGHGMDLLAITPIGFFSWLAVAPDELEPQGRELLFQVESNPNLLFQGAGRYLLVTAEKRAVERAR